MKNLENVKALWIALVALVMLTATTPLLAAWECLNDQRCNGKFANLCGDGNNNTIPNNDDENVIHAAGGADHINATDSDLDGKKGESDDTLCGKSGTGADVIEGGYDDDFLDGGSGSLDHCKGQNDNSGDTCTGCLINDGCE